MTPADLESLREWASAHTNSPQARSVLELLRERETLLDQRNAAIAQVKEWSDDHEKAIRQRDEARKQLDQYAQVIERGKRLPAPDLMQDPAFAAFVLGGLESELAFVKAGRDKLAAFKAYVHARLDGAGVTTDPESSHKHEGCRIGGRLDEVFAERDRLRATLVGFVEEICKELDRRAAQAERAIDGACEPDHVGSLSGRNYAFEEAAALLRKQTAELLANNKKVAS